MGRKAESEIIADGLDANPPQQLRRDDMCVIYDCRSSCRVIVFLLLSAIPPLHLVCDHAAAHGVHDAVDPTDAVQGAKRF